MRTAQRKTLAPGVYLDHGVIEIRATSHGQTLVERLPGDTDLPTAKRKRAQLVARAKTLHPRPKAHTLALDAERYLALQRRLVNYSSLRGIMAHWIALYGDRPRYRLTPHDIREARNTWLDAGAAPKSINHRVAALRHLCHVLDGPTAPTPCDGLPPLHVPRTPLQRVSDATILAVDAALAQREQTFHMSAKTRARFRVLVSTGKRPSELMRATPADVDLEARVWVTRDGKGGWSPGVYLNDDMLAGWRLFVEADAWGPFNLGSFSRTLRAAGWPATVRVYNARHTTWITAVERGADMADVQQGAGHKSLRTTVTHYTGVRDSRMQRLAELLDGRFRGFAVGENLGAPDSPSKTGQKPR